MDIKLNKKFPDCANEALVLIRSNFNRVSKQELQHLAYEFIFFYEFKPDQKIWTKKANPMQELQCADCIMNFLETEKEAQIREYIFDLLFDDIHQVSTKYILQLLLSYSLSLEARNTLDCISKWLIMNIGNEIIQNIFDQLITDHFLLVKHKQNPQSLINLATISPLFSSLFMTIILDMLPNNLISNHEKCLKRIFNLFSSWLEKNPIIPVIAFKANLSHSMHNMFNPLPGLIYICVLYPFKAAIECLEKHSNQNNEKQKNQCIKRFEELETIVANVQLMTLKLLKNISNIIESTNLFAADNFKLLKLKHIESITKRYEDLNNSFERIAKRSDSNNCVQSVKSVEMIRNDCLDRLAQHLEACWKNGFADCKKQESRKLFTGRCFNTDIENLQNGDLNLLTIVLNN